MFCNLKMIEYPPGVVPPSQSAGMAVIVTLAGFLLWGTSELTSYLYTSIAPDILRLDWVCDNTTTVVEQMVITLDDFTVDLGCPGNIANTSVGQWVVDNVLYRPSLNWTVPVIPVLYTCVDSECLVSSPILNGFACLPEGSDGRCEVGKHCDNRGECV